MKVKFIDIKDFEKAFGEKATDFMRDRILSYNFSYNNLAASEKDKLVLSILKKIENGLERSGEHRLDAWNSGWGENRDLLKKDISLESLIPKYFGKFPYVRWKKEFIKPSSANFEYNMVQVMQYWFFEKFLSSVETIYEFGCGTGHNLFRASQTNPRAEIWGLDWAKSSQETINLINEKLDVNFNSRNFDFFNIDKSFRLNKNSGVYTFAALEQVGESHKNFINYLIEQKPEVCLHIEPIAEMIDDEDLNDYLSIQYFKARNYLSSFYDYLLDLESQNKIEMLFSKPSFIGSQYINGYSVVAWRPKNV